MAMGRVGLVVFIERPGTLPQTKVDLVMGVIEKAYQSSTRGEALVGEAAIEKGAEMFAAGRAREVPREG